MKLSEFIVLTQEEKRAVVLQQGVALTQRNFLNFMVFLFQLPDFYVETYCCRESKEIQEYRTYLNPEHLQPYLQAISIDL